MSKKYSLAKPPIAAGESREEYNQLFAMVARDYEPCSAYELFLVTKMTNIHWRILRMEHAEARRVTKNRMSRRAGVSVKEDRREPIDGMRLEAALYKTLGELRKEFHCVRVQRELLAIKHNESRANMFRPAIEKKLLANNDEQAE